MAGWLMDWLQGWYLVVWLVGGMASALVFGCLFGWWDGIWLSEVLVVEFGRVSHGPMRQELYCCKQF